MMELQEQKNAKWWAAADAAVLAVYSTVVLWTLQYHEKWADEAQAWLIARDLDLRTIWFHELRYEGSPGLWHTILWVAQHAFHAKYGALGYIGVAFAIAGAAVLIFAAPFPRYIRWPLAFTYVMVYQYAVIARPYTLLPLLAFCAAIYFQDNSHPERITIVLALLSMLTLHGAILAGCLGLAYLVEAKKAWASFDTSIRRRYWVCGVILACVFLFLFKILKPTPDVEEFALKQELARLPDIVRAQQPTRGMKLESILTGAFLDYPALSVLFVFAVGAWCAIRRKFLVFALPVVTLIGLYVSIHGYSHHHGTVTIAALTGVWIAWPSKEEQPAMSLNHRRALQGVIVCLGLFCVINILDSAVVIKHEYLYPYSGAEDATRFLNENGAQRRPIFGLLYGMVAIQPYFDHNIFANVHTTYFHHGTPLEGTMLDESELQRVAPGFIVAFTEQPQLMVDSGVMNSLVPLGYKMVHFSDGYLLYKRGVYVRQAYFIYQRMDGDPGVPIHPR